MSHARRSTPLRAIFAMIMDSNSGANVTRPEDSISILAIGSAILRARRPAARSAIVGAVLLTVPVLFFDRTWTTSASFAPQSSELQASGLLGLAGQLGVQVPGATGAIPQTPD